MKWIFVYILSSEQHIRARSGLIILMKGFVIKDLQTSVALSPSLIVSIACVAFCYAINFAAAELMSTYIYVSYVLARVKSCNSLIIQWSSCLLKNLWESYSFPSLVCISQVSIYRTLLCLARLPFLQLARRDRVSLVRRDQVSLVRQDQVSLVRQYQVSLVWQDQVSLVKQD